MTDSDKKSFRSCKFCTLGVNVVVFGLFAAITLLLRSEVTPFRRGFFCDDISIKYPQRTQTVKTSVLLPVNFAVAIFLFSIAEYLNSDKSTKIRAGCFAVPEFASRVFHLFFIFLWGVMATSMTTDVIKVSLGVLRPNFFSVCQPNISCTNSEEYGIYHTEYHCQGADENKENDARASFPSGHASQAAFAALFIVFYIQERLSRVDSFLLVPCIQLSLISSALWSAMTRISDYVHHPMDVAAGILVGFVIATGLSYQTILWLRTRDLHKSELKTEEAKHLATLQSELAAERSPNGQV